LKKAVQAPLACLLLPGVGQLINQQWNKAVVFVMAASFLLLITFTVLAFKVYDVWGAPNPPVEMNALLREALFNRGATYLWVLGGFWAALWLASMADAFWAGRALDRAGQGKKEQD